ncbi:hypothetical protein [Desulfovibrio cuneatus]|uniref:hypothetical protein n=1 Tax=Desulfovibrio cuneatus TaxID=159728 RepID=UPI0004089D1E|nr:hypothetical protein [Desulfovibrio cuneatus]
MTDNRKFSGSVSIRLGTQRVKLELSPAPLHGGEEGLFRVRVGRRWHDALEGEPLFFHRASLAELIGHFLGEAAFPPLPEAPDLPRNTRVTVNFWHNGQPEQEGVWTATPPIRALDGKFYVGVMTYAAGFIFVPVNDVTIVDKRHAKR